MTVPFLEPTQPIADRREVLLGYLSYFRGQLVGKLGLLPADELRTSRLPSGWTPLELLKHLTFVEMRWLDWGFSGTTVTEPWGDQREDRWFVDADETLADLVAALTTRAARSREIVLTHGLADVGAPGERWNGAPPATLERVLLHLLQEYARHVGHLDVVVELATGDVGE